MRKLTVIRKKAVVGCLGKVKIYIADADGDTYITGFKCRLLGKVKNNSSSTFEIPCKGVKIFAIYDQMTKDFCNDRYDVPEGEEDVVVSGKVDYNPLAGNPFYFDKVNDGETLIIKKERSKRSWIIFVSIAASAFVLGLVGGLLYHFI